MSTKTTRVYTCTLAMCLGTQEKYSLTHSLLHIYSLTALHLLTHCSTSTHSLLHIYSLTATHLLTHCSTSTHSLLHIYTLTASHLLTHCSTSTHSLLHIYSLTAPHLLTHCSTSTHSLLHIYTLTAPHLLTHCSTSTHSLLHIYSLTHCAAHLTGEYFGFLFAVICTSSSLQLPSSSFSLNSCSPSSQNSPFPPAAARVCLFLFLRSSSSEDGGVRPSKWPTSSLLSCLRDLMG